MNTVKQTVSWLSVCVALALLGLSIHMHFVSSHLGDKQWEMLLAQMLLNGKKLYKDIFVVSAPSIYWIYAIPAALTRGMPSPAEFNALTFMGLTAIAGSIYVCTRLMSLHPGFANRRNLLVEFALLLALILTYRVISAHFLDREHIFYLLTAPYMIRFLPALQTIRIPPALRVATGVMAGIGFLIKPHCLIVWVGMQLLCYLYSRSFRLLLNIENGLVCSIGILYAGCIWWFTPEYISVVMAIATYSAVRSDKPTMHFAANSISVLVPIFLLFRPGHETPFRRDIYYLLCMCGLFAIYICLNNGWWYTYLPLDSTALLLAGFMFWQFRCLKQQQEAAQERTLISTLGIWACLLALIMKLILSFDNFHSLSFNYFYFIYRDPCRDNIACNGDNIFVSEIKGENGHPLSFGAITIDPTRWTRLVHFSGAAWVTRFSQLWMLPKFIQSDESFRHKYAWILEYVADAYADDMNKNKPDIIFVDDTDFYYTASFNLDLVKLFDASRRFHQAFSHYRYDHGIDACGEPRPEDVWKKVKCSYFIYRRIPDETDTGGTP